MKTSFSGRNAFKHLEELTVKIGPRHGGSKSEKKAAEYISRYFKGLGLKTKLEPYEIYSFEDAVGSLTTPSGESIECIAFPMSADTPEKGITKETIFIESTHPVSLDERVKDKIVVMFNAFGGELLDRFHSYKPAGLVSIQTNAYGMHFRGAHNIPSKRKYGTIPTVKLTYEHGIKLIESLPEKLTMKVKTIDEGLKKGYNVVADLKGSADSDEVIVICGHYDSVWMGPGALDNGGGVAGIMELARVYKENGSKWNLRFIAFGGEEMGLWGSKGYVRRLKKKHDKLKKDDDFKKDGLKTEIDQIKMVLNLDMMGPYYGNSTAITIGHSDLPASVRLLAKEIKYPVAVREDQIYSSDNIPFNCLKIPSLSFHRCGFGDGGGHTVNDTIDKCSPEGLKHICGFVQEWLDRYIINQDYFPFPGVLSEGSAKVVEQRSKDTGIFEAPFAPVKKFKKKK